MAREALRKRLPMTERSRSSRRRGRRGNPIVTVGDTVGAEQSSGFADEDFRARASMPKTLRGALVLVRCLRPRQGCTHRICALSSSYAALPRSSAWAARSSCSSARSLTSSASALRPTRKTSRSPCSVASWPCCAVRWHGLGTRQPRLAPTNPAAAAASTVTLNIRRGSSEASSRARISTNTVWAKPGSRNPARRRPTSSERRN
jgi:hypothetical protein